jgi:hypothetical protein
MTYVKKILSSKFPNLEFSIQQNKKQNFFLFQSCRKTRKDFQVGFFYIFTFN